MRRIFSTAILLALAACSRAPADNINKDFERLESYQDMQTIPQSAFTTCPVEAIQELHKLEAQPQCLTYGELLVVLSFNQEPVIMLATRKPITTIVTRKVLAWAVPVLWYDNDKITQQKVTFEFEALLDKLRAGGARTREEIATENSRVITQAVTTGKAP